MTAPNPLDTEQLREQIDNIWKGYSHDAGIDALVDLFYSHYQYEVRQAIDLTELFKARKVLTDRIASLSGSYLYRDEVQDQVNEQLEKLDTLIVAALNETKDAA